MQSAFGIQQMCLFEYYQQAKILWKYVSFKTEKNKLRHYPRPSPTLVVESIWRAEFKEQRGCLARKAWPKTALNFQQSPGQNQQE